MLSVSEDAADFPAIETGAPESAQLKQPPAHLL